MSYSKIESMTTEQIYSIAHQFPMKNVFNWVKYFYLEPTCAPDSTKPESLFSLIYESFAIVTGSRAIGGDMIAAMSEDTYNSLQSVIDSDVSVRAIMDNNKISGMQSVFGDIKFLVNNNISDAIYSHKESVLLLQDGPDFIEVSGNGEDVILKTPHFHGIIIDYCQ